MASSKVENLLSIRYSEKDLIFTSSRSSLDESWFDRKLSEGWNHALEMGYFRYKLNVVESKILPGKCGYFAQLNPDRGHNRRQSDDISSLNQPFDHSRFNFTKVKPEEFLFQLVKDETESGDADYIVINVSPLEFGNSLFVPSLRGCHPQVITCDSLMPALEIVLLSSTTSLRVGFNSLCGYASVNHLHYHLYYLKQAMPLETISARRLSGPCHELVDYPARGFVFELHDNHDVAALARSVHKLTSYFHVENVAHNLFVTRGAPLDAAPSVAGVYDTLRVFVWARQSSTGAKESAAFNPALCELFGHLNVKDKTLYDGLTEESVSSILEDVCIPTFQTVRPFVIKLFQEV